PAFSVFEFTLPQKRFCILKRGRGFGNRVRALLAGSRLLAGSSLVREETRAQRNGAGQYRPPAPSSRRLSDKATNGHGYTPARPHPAKKPLMINLAFPESVG